MHPMHVKIMRDLRSSICDILPKSCLYNISNLPSVHSASLTTINGQMYTFIPGFVSAKDIIRMSHDAFPSKSTVKIHIS